MSIRLQVAQIRLTDHCFKRLLSFCPLTTLDTCIGVLTLCLGQQVHLLGTIVTVHIQFAWTCCALQS